MISTQANGGLGGGVGGGGLIGGHHFSHQQARYPLVVSFRKIPPRPSLGGGGGLQSNNNCYNINDNEQMRQRTNTFDTIYVSSMRPTVCFSIDETCNANYNKDLNGSPQQQQQQQPLIGFDHTKGKWVSQVCTTQQHNRDMSGTDSSPTYGSTYEPTHDRIYHTKSDRSGSPLTNRFYVSPYDSPELSAETRRFQENLNNILKELVFKGETMDYDSHQHRNVERWLRQNKLTSKLEPGEGAISKSSSMPCFFRT